jgi:YVTN family beta-propeller protein
MFALFPLIVLAALSNALAIDPPRPTNSSPVAISTDDAFVWVVNRDNNSVTLFNVANDVNLKIIEVKVGKEPRTLALTPDGAKLFVTNMVDGTVTVISNLQVIATIPVGTEPFGCALTPDGTRLYVANFGSDDVSLIDTNSLKVVKTITGVGPKPRGIAITAGNPAKVYVTNFLALLRNDNRPVTEKEGRDDGKEGHVTVISAASNTVTDIVTLNPLANTGFNSDGSTLDRVTVPPAAAGSFITGAFPNLLQSIVIQGNRAYLPNTASSPNGPFKFNVNVQGFLSVFDTGTDTDSGQTINMNNGVQNEDPKVKLFITNPIAIAFDRTGT